MQINIQKSLYRTDFTAIYECSNCDRTCVDVGYDEAKFRAEVVPKMPCQTCGLCEVDLMARKERMALLEEVKAL